MNQTESRKDDHINISLNEDVSGDGCCWDKIHFIHNALPEVNKDEIDLSTTLFGKKIGFPLAISSMTGGYEKAKEINENLAYAASEYDIPMGVGSQRAALENKSLEDTYGIIKDFDIPLRFANIGASQIVLWDRKKMLDKAYDMIEMIDADVFVVCLNFLQEVIQYEGESHAKGCTEKISYLVDNLDLPVMVKETGAGISYDVAERLSDNGVSAIDVGGYGGTSFAAIEYYRAKKIDDDLHARGGKTFWNWGIPTPYAIGEVGKAVDWKIPVIATGGIRNGLDGAKALGLGADAFGMAHKLLKPAVKGKKDIVNEIDALYKELRAAMFLIGAEKISEIKKSLV
ncbi:MAG: type 2 isopentenyl-diphosphate Delta-isomerase [Candidatus Thermoplasmatota archaeon]